MNFQYASEEAELADVIKAISLSQQEAQISQSNDRSVQNDGLARSRTGLFDFSKTWMYANSRLPPFMPPMVVYMPTWRILCMAARASLEVYEKPKGEERQHRISASWQQKTKAMIVKSRPMDDQNLVILAIRGSELNFADWSVNFHPEPTSPAGFLDDRGNACHAGFLAVAQATIRPVAARLRQLLEENPSRISSSLVITGHSAGGAVAALLYAHILSSTVNSELTALLGCFKRVHCVTFGAPPITLLPLTKPDVPMAKKSVFMSFVNEGDPVTRADKAYIISLAHLLASATPVIQTPKVKISKQIFSRGKKSQQSTAMAPYWQLPPATLSTAGKMILLRSSSNSLGQTQVEAATTSDEQLRSFVFGDPSMHSMAIYKDRIDRLAIAAVTGSVVK